MDLNNFKTELEGYLSKLSGNTRIPVGQLWWGFDPKSKPAGVQLFAGQELSRAAYQKHWELISSGKRTLVTESEWQSYVSQNGFCPYYSSGDGSTTYRMPLVKNVHPEFVSALIDAGQYIEAGLPNITSVRTPSLLTGATGVTPVVGSALWFGSYSNGIRGGSSSGGYFYMQFDASLSNPIYGNSDTVQPPSLTFLIGEYVISSVATIGEADKNSILEMVNKLEINISNMIKSVNGVGADINGNIDVISLMMPDYSAGVAFTANTDITAPYNCCLVCYVQNSKYESTPSFSMIVDGNTILPVRYGTSAGGFAMPFTLFVKKGSVFRIATTGSQSEVYYRYYPLKGIN